MGGQHPLSAARRRRLGTHLLPVALLAAGAFAAGALVGMAHGANQRAAARRYLAAWSHGDYAAMYALLDEASRQRLSERAFAAAYRSDAITATELSIRPVRVGRLHAGLVPVRVLLATRLFGTLRETVEIPVSGGPVVHVHFLPTLLFPGLRAGERLTRTVVMPPRSSLLAADGTPLAEGRGRTSPIPDVAGAIAGVLGPIPAGQAAAFAAAGYPRGALVGLDGLEHIFERRLAGTPGGVLRAGRRVLAQRPPRGEGPLRTTIVPALERALVTAMAGRYAGMVALDPRTGAIMAAAGVAFSALQPPGSTMKIVTSTGLLAAGLVKLGDVFPVSTEATIDGFPLQNANGEACGGTLLDSFAVSCNSVFAPLGVRLGAARLLAIARRFGFNEPPPLSGEPASTIPARDLSSSALELGASAIGQGKVQATTLQMADVAATVAMGGRRPLPTLLAGAPPRFVHVMSHHVAALVQRMMVAVVNSSDGTGYAAQIPGVEVAGKTGTAELRNTADKHDPNANSPSNTDAWFVGYAPVGHPRLVVGALFPGQGAGGATAAPAVRQVLEAGLSLGR